MEAKHTATPWGQIHEIDAFTLGIDYPDNDERDHYLCTVTCGDPDELRANAEFIYNACHAHDDLLNACKAVDADIELTGHVSQKTVEMVRAAIIRVGAA